MATISVINESTVLADGDVEQMVNAIQTQVTRDFAPHWHANAKLVFVPKGQAPQPGTWQMVVLDDTDQAGALGYHEETSDGQPLGKVFARTDLDYGLLVAVTLSHEILEMLADPYINRCVMRQPSASQIQIWPVEVCDAVEDDQFSYQIDGVAVSDFVLPDYFRDIVPPNTKVDFQGVLPHGVVVPALTAGGYMAEFDGSGQWTQVFGEHVPDNRAHPDRVRGRYNRRTKPRHEWKRSTRVW